ncbi:hypothetical protein J2X32_000325 [Rheinheimera pacifica]|nr:hypothetical protein [Rheinheimera pacifica]
MNIQLATSINNYFAIGNDAFVLNGDKIQSLEIS